MKKRQIAFTQVATHLIANLKFYWPYIILVLGYLSFFWHYIWPVWGNSLYAVGDLSFHVRYALSARHAIEQGQFSYTNDAQLSLQPSFVYYNPLFLFVSGLLQLILRVNAYKSILVSVCLFAGLGLLGTDGSLRTSNCQKTYSAIGAVSFLFYAILYH